mgnify:CR=1 FL=1
MRDIYTYVAKDSPSAADRLVESFLDRANVLTDFPMSGYLYGVKSGREVRVLLQGHYRIAYVIKENADIDILGVFHGAMEIERYLNLQ